MPRASCSYNFISKSRRSMRRTRGKSVDHLLYRVANFVRVALWPANDRCACPSGHQLLGVRIHHVENHRAFGIIGHIRVSAAHPPTCYSGRNRKARFGYSRSPSRCIAARRLSPGERRGAPRRDQPSPRGLRGFHAQRVRRVAHPAARPRKTARAFAHGAQVREPRFCIFRMMPRGHSRL